MFRRHFSDEQLLAHLDGEMPDGARRRLDAHLRSCWSCRARQAALEHQIHRIAEAFVEPGFPDDDWLPRQIVRFRRLEALQAAEAVAPLASAPPRRSFRPMCIAAAVATVIVALVLRLAPASDTEIAARFVSAAKQAEASQAAQPLHQRFRVELERAGEDGFRQSGNLEIWSDPAGRRYSARWENGEDLAFGAWRPNPGDEHWHGARSEQGTQSFHLASVSVQPSSLEELEGLFVRWLASRQWRPVSIGGEVSWFPGQERVTLQAERFQSDGQRFVRITARRPTAGSFAILTAEFALSDYRPRLFRLRWQDGSGAAEIRLMAERIDAGPQVEFKSAVFEPDSRLARPTAPKLSLPSPPARQAPERASAAPLTERELLERELEVRYALHRIGTCLGDSVEIEIAPGGQVVVTGLADQEARRAAIQQAVQDLNYVTVEVRTVAEATAEPDPAGAGTLAQSAAIAPEVVTGGEPLIQERLSWHFRQIGASGEDVPEARIQRRIAALSNDATATTAELLAHAWAVRRLHSAYPPGRVALLRPQSRWILEDIMQDHIAAIQGKAGAALGMLEPVLGAAAFGPAKRPEDISFAQVIEEFFQLAEETNRMSRGVFALSRLPVDEQPGAAAMLLANLARLQRDAPVLRNRVAAEFQHTPRAPESQAARDSTVRDSQERTKP